MKKKCFFTIVMYMLFSLFFCCEKNVLASDIFIESLPMCEDIEYGEPLFESNIIGGSANVDGVFKFKDSELMLDAGNHSVEVIFISNEEPQKELIINVNITVHKKRVYIKFLEALYKQYDDSREILLPSYIVSGIRSNENVYVSGRLKGILDSAFVTNNANVILDGIELKGERKDNYYLDLDGFKASVYPREIENLFNDKNRIEFSSNIYVPINSVINVRKLDDISLVNEGYQIKDIYDVYLTSDSSRVDVNGRVKIKIKIDEEVFSYARLEVFNYYNNKYEKISDYEYKDGYFIYEVSSLGQLVFAQRQINYNWIYYLLAYLLLSFMIYFVLKLVKNRKKINKYKSLKRRKKYGNC